MQTCCCISVVCKTAQGSLFRRTSIGIATIQGLKIQKQTIGSCMQELSSYGHLKMTKKFKALDLQNDEYSQPYKVLI